MAGQSRPNKGTRGDYLPTDVVARDAGSGILHIGIVGDVTSENGSPCVIHDIGAGAREEDIQFRYRIIGHYLLPMPVATP